MIYYYSTEQHSATSSFVGKYGIGICLLDKSCMPDVTATDVIVLNNPSERILRQAYCSFGDKASIVVHYDARFPFDNMTTLPVHIIVGDKKLVNKIFFRQYSECLTIRAASSNKYVIRAIHDIHTEVQGRKTVTISNSVVVLSGYCGIQMRPFSESMRLLISSSITNVVYVGYSAYDRYNISDSTVIIMMPPERYWAAKALVGTDSGNKFVLWNVEIVDFSGKCERGKIHYRAGVLKAIYNSGNKVWDYSYNTTKCLGEKSSFVPIGYNRSFEVMRDDKISSSVVFAGHISSERKKVIGSITSKKEGAVLFTKDNFSDVETMYHNMSKYYIGIDIPHNKFVPNVCWHRIITYAYAGLASILPLDLRQYGLIPDRHYIYYKDAKCLASQIVALKKDPHKCLEMVSNMREALYENFDAEIMFGNLVGEINE